MGKITLDLPGILWRLQAGACAHSGKVEPTPHRKSISQSRRAGGPTHPQNLCLSETPEESDSPDAPAPWCPPIPSVSLLLSFARAGHPQRPSPKCRRRLIEHSAIRGSGILGAGDRRVSTLSGMVMFSVDPPRVRDNPHNLKSWHWENVPLTRMLAPTATHIPG